MSKNMETEYKNFAQESTPDLWNRIEDALPDKILVKAEENTKAEAVEKPLFWKRYGKFMPLAAAALLLIFFVPAAYQLGFGKSAASEMAAADNAAPSEEAEEEEVLTEMEESFAQGTDSDEKTVVNEEMQETEAMQDGAQADQAPMAQDEQGICMNFPFLELNQTVRDGEKLLSAEIKIERKDHSVSLDEGTRKIESYYELPVLQEQTEATRKINRDLYKQYQEAMKNEDIKAWKQSFAEEDMYEEAFYGFETFLSYNENGIISLGMYEESWCGGPASRSVYSYTYDLNTGERLNLADILGVKEEELHATLLQGFVQSAKEDTENILWEVYTPQELIERLADYEAEDFSYCINQNGEVDIWFAKYELMSGADGMQAVTIGKVNYGQ